MKKSTLINQVNKNTKIPLKDVEVVINLALEIIANSLKNGDFVSLYGFGSFSLVKRKAKELYIPGSKNKVKVPEKYAIKFTPSNKLKRTIESIDDI